MTTEELRQAFLIDDLFERGAISLTYCETERSIVGSAVPANGELHLEGGRELGGADFAERRETGVINVGAPGSVTVDRTVYDMEGLDGLYIGRGAREILFDSKDRSDPSMFYLVSYPAHADYPTTHAKKSEAEEVHLGSPEDANERVIFKYIHPGGIKSCQLVMGITSLKSGSVWNTMPAHTHERRTEVYMYFDAKDGSVVFHFMGTQDETRHIAVANRQAVISPMWSIHSGCGTGNYSFVWGMGGENQAFDDLDPIKIPDLR
jgi:4-deoxy-L-threo-5-hexosulose-uronate ketol-isomerase